MEENPIRLSMVRATGPGSEGRVTYWVDSKQARWKITREIYLYGTMGTQSNCALDKLK